MSEREALPALLKPAIPDGYCQKPACQQVIENLTNASRHAGCDSSAGTLRSREARSPGQLPALLRPGQLIPATGAGKFLPWTPAARGSVLCHRWGASTPLLLLLQQQRQNNSHFSPRQSQLGSVLVLCRKDRDPSGIFGNKIMLLEAAPFLSVFPD